MKTANYTLDLPIPGCSSSAQATQREIRKSALREVLHLILAKRLRSDSARYLSLLSDDPIIYFPRRSNYTSFWKELNHLYQLDLGTGILFLLLEKCSPVTSQDSQGTSLYLRLQKASFIFLGRNLSPSIKLLLFSH